MTAPQGMEKILDRIKRLFAKADSAAAVGSMAEAEAFAAGAQKTLAFYKLDMAMLDDAEQEAQDPLSHGYCELDRTDPWTRLLVATVARAHYCRAFRGRDNRIRYFGRQNDVAVATYVTAQLTRCALALVEVGLRIERRAGRSTRGYRVSYFKGFVTAISEKYKAFRETESTGGLAMVRAKSTAEVEAYMQSVVGRTVTRKLVLSGTHGRAYSEGHAAGMGASLSANGLKTAGNQPKRLGSGVSH